MLFWLYFSPGVTLELRLEYLARAIMSAKSCNLRTAGSGDGEFLHGLEEKLEVARIQMQVYQALVRINSANPSRRIDQALIGLNSQLFDVTKVRAFSFPSLSDLHESFPSYIDTLSRKRRLLFFVISLGSVLFPLFLSFPFRSDSPPYRHPHFLLQ